MRATARGFESLPLRHITASAIALAVIFLCRRACLYFAAALFHNRLRSPYLLGWKRSHYRLLLPSTICRRPPYGWCYKGEKLILMVSSSSPQAVFTPLAANFYTKVSPSHSFNRTARISQTLSVNGSRKVSLYRDFIFIPGKYHLTVLAMKQDAQRGSFYS